MQVYIMPRYIHPKLLEDKHIRAYYKNILVIEKPNCYIDIEDLLENFVICKSFSEDSLLLVEKDKYDKGYKSTNVNYSSAVITRSKQKPGVFDLLKSYIEILEE